MTRRPRLTRPIQPLARPDGAIQLGLDPRSALVTRGVTAAECRWLSTLDGSREEGQVITAAAAHGITAERAESLIASFAEHGLVDRDGVVPDLRKAVAVVGAGSVPAHLAETLREAGVHPVRRLIDGLSDDEPAAAELAVLVCPVPVPAGAGETWRAAGTAHLPVWCGRTHASVGPLVVPGAGPCLQCLELTRVTLDPGWSWIRAQISRPQVGPVVPVEAEVTLRSLVVGIAAGVVIDTLTSGPDPSGWSLDAFAPGPCLERRRWPRQPGCPRCGVDQAASPPADAQAPGRQWAG
ncbi:cyclodehydratase [Marihabitans asiaticum]|uniref:Bacteriocin biosynthesis cyclodehydratase domain-containing protein n=1 Tax=Marihabitans asiaticum TaxID=415218 RepID=A0A560WIX9_9MICO|nr:hypothetical protein [Marihabitans asiaticum]TWD17355.1 hypothetical protein FB557_0922 [Marihabitans asiaticum]